MKVSRSVGGVPDEKFRADFARRLKAPVLRGDYRSALAIARDALRRYPADLECRYQYAKLLGDWADELPPARKKKLKAEAVRILRPLTRRLGGRPFDQRFGICLNLYYQSRDFAGMYRFGKRVARTRHPRAWYAQGLGAGLRAQELHEAGRPGVRAWAEKSVRAWNRYGLRGDRYYFAHYAAALSLALAGRKKEARARLRVAARLGRRPLSDWEFADVMQLISTQ